MTISFKSMQRSGLLIYQDMLRCDLFKHAYAMAYVTLFSLIPSLAAVFGLVSLFKPFMGDDKNPVVMLKSFVLKHLAEGSGSDVISYIDRFLRNLDITKIGLTGFAGMLITLILLLKQIEVAFNRIFQVAEPRHLIVRFIYFWTFLTLGTFLISLSVGILSGFNLSNLVPWGQQPVHQNPVLATFFAKMGTFVFFTLLYKFVPNCIVPLKNAALGSIVATILLDGATRFYSIYTSSFTNYHAVYGALAAIPIFLFWLYILWVITLLGSVITWRSQQGFKVDERLMSDGGKVTIQASYRNISLQRHVPVILLLAIHQRFRDGIALGKGATGEDLVQKLGLPPAWVKDGLELLLKKEFIIFAGKDTSDQIHDPLMENFFPTQPADRIVLRSLFNALDADLHQWIQDWQQEWALPLPKILIELQKSIHEPLGEKTIADLILKSN